MDKKQTKHKIRSGLHTIDVVVNLAKREDGETRPVIFYATGVNDNIQGPGNLHGYLADVFQQNYGDFVRIGVKSKSESQFVADVRKAVTTIYDEPEKYGVSSGPLFLAGYKSGASAAASLVNELNPERLLLFSPCCGYVSFNAVATSLFGFNGHTDIFCGELDRNYNHNMRPFYLSTLSQSPKKEHVVVGACSEFLEKQDELSAIVRLAMD